MAVFDRFLLRSLPPMLTLWSASSGRMRCSGADQADLVTTPRQCGILPPIGNLKPNEWRATSLGTSALAVSDSVVLISGLWQIENVVDGKPAITPYE